MNTNTISAECAHGLCSDCNYQDCACECHLEEGIDDPEWVCPHCGESGVAPGAYCHMVDHN
jgi:hypothetical protein